MKFSPTVPLLSVGLVLAMILAVQTLRKHGKLSQEAALAARIIILTMTIWGLVSTGIALKGWYLEFSTLFLVGIGFATPFTVLGLGVILFPNLRLGLHELVQVMPLKWVTYIHAVRILSVGTIGKYLSGSLPGHFILPMGIPDLLFGLTAPIIGYFALTRKSISSKTLMTWHVLGGLMFLPAIPLMHLSVPSPIQIVFEGPTTAEVLSFPMVLVPSFIVPLYLLFHGMAVWKLWELKEAVSHKRVMKASNF